MALLRASLEAPGVLQSGALRGSCQGAERIRAAIASAREDVLG